MHDEPAPESPWLRIPLADYEGHMALPQVAQAALLADEFARFLLDLAPRSVAIVGCAGGNGLERVDPTVTTRVTALDLNPGFVEAARARFAARFACFDAVVADIGAEGAGDRAGEPVDLVWAALLFEYVDPAAALRQLARLVRRGGTLATLVQEPNAAQPAVTPSPYTSLAPLGRALRHVTPQELAVAAVEAGFVEAFPRRGVAAGAKRFSVQAFRREAQQEGSA